MTKEHELLQLILKSEGLHPDCIHSPITLERILLALGKYNKYSINCHGELLEDFPGKKWGTGHSVVVCTYNLNGSQTEKTYQQLIELLK